MSLSEIREAAVRVWNDRTPAPGAPDIEKHDWTVKLYAGRHQHGEVRLPQCTDAEARTWAQNSVRVPITGAVLYRAGHRSRSGQGAVVRFGDAARETW